MHRHRHCCPRCGRHFDAWQALECHLLRCLQEELWPVAVDVGSEQSLPAGAVKNRSVSTAPPTTKSVSPTSTRNPRSEP